MKFIMLTLLALALSAAVSGKASASSGLVIHTAEFGVGKFHRADNRAHAYGANQAWSPYILPDGTPTDHAFVQKNTDGSFTIFFSTLEELVANVVQISHDQGQPVSVLNVHGHGLPGAMWFPKDQNDLNDWSCSDWKNAANGSDSDNYDQYYSPVSISEIRQIRDMSNTSGLEMGCTVGLKEWQAAVAHAPEFKTVFAPDAQLHFLSCVVGLGTVGDQFTKGIAELILPGGKGRVETSTNFGLGDWSMPAGMGFWDYVTESQVNHDNSVYPVDHKDAEIAQKGTVRVAQFANSQWGTVLLGGRDVMSLAFETNLRGMYRREPEMTSVSPSALPTRIRIPGTRAYTQVK